jgi:hypothetical protein
MVSTTIVALSATSEWCYFRSEVGFGRRDPAAQSPDIQVWTPAFGSSHRMITMYAAMKRMKPTHPGIQLFPALSSCSMSPRSVCSLTAPT